MSNEKVDPNTPLRELKSINLNKGNDSGFKYLEASEVNKAIKHIERAIKFLELENKADRLRDRMQVDRSSKQDYKYIEVI